MRKRIAFGLLIGGVLIAELGATPAPAPQLGIPRDAHAHDVYRFHYPKQDAHGHDVDRELLERKWLEQGPQDAHGHDIDRDNAPE
jgi:hypothetical protein